MSTARVVMRSIWRKASGKYALTVLGLWVLVSLVSLVWTPHTLLETDGFHAWASPSAAHPLGTDGVGADVLSWLMAGSRTNLAIALLTVAVSGIFGLALVAAMVSRNTVLRSTSVVVVDALISIPTVLIALMLSVRRLGGGDCGRMRIRLRTESGAYRKTCGRTRRAFAVC